jgi:hypothetical protein
MSNFNCGVLAWRVRSSAFRPFREGHCCQNGLKAELRADTAFIAAGEAEMLPRFSARATGRAGAANHRA